MGYMYVYFPPPGNSNFNRSSSIKINLRCPQPPQICMFDNNFMQPELRNMFTPRSCHDWLVNLTSSRTRSANKNVKSWGPAADSIPIRSPVNQQWTPWNWFAEAWPRRGSIPILAGSCVSPAWKSNETIRRPPGGSSIYGVLTTAHMTANWGEHPKSQMSHESLINIKWTLRQRISHQMNNKFNM